MPVSFAAAALALALVVAMTAAVSIGAVTVPFGQVWSVVLHHVTGRGATGDPATDQIVWTFRTPRVLLAAVVGAALAVSGGVLQTLVANPLADPAVLGFSSGASVGAVLVITLGGAAAGGVGVAGAAFVGALAAGVLVFALGQRAGRLAPTRLVLAGVAVGNVLLALTGFLQLRATPTELRTVMFWMLGSVAGAQWGQLPTVTAVVVAATGVLALLGRRMNALLAGDDSATAMGVDADRLRAVLLVLCALLTGSAIAVAGGIGFVGLMIPHLVRLTTGADHRRLLPLSALLGAVYLVVVDLLSRTLDSPNELPLGILTALLGAPFFLWLLRRSTSMD